MCRCLHLKGSKAHLQASLIPGDDIPGLPLKRGKAEGKGERGVCVTAVGGMDSLV